MSGFLNVEKCVRYLRSVGVEITAQTEREWLDTQNVHRFTRTMKRPARTGWDWWCPKEHQNFTEHHRGRRRDWKKLACRVCGGGVRGMRRRYDIAIDGTLRDYRDKDVRWRALDWLPAPFGDEPPPMAML